MSKKKSPQYFPGIEFIDLAVAMRKAQNRYLATRSQADHDAKLAIEAEFDVKVAERDAAKKALEQM